MEKNKPTSETIINRLSIMMSGFKEGYPKKNEWSIPLVNPPKVIKNFSVHRFYTSNIRNRGTAFYEAYEAATESMDNKELCTNIGSMLCDVYDGFRSSIEEALYGIGVRPTVAWLPSDGEVLDSLDWAFILIYFGCIIIILLKKFTDERNYNTFMVNFIRELSEIIEYDADLDVPFGFKKANAIKTNLGSSSRLCEEAIRFILKKSNALYTEQYVGSICLYLCNVLAWSDMRHFTLINDMLVKPQSPILFHSLISSEVSNYNEACSAITSHICPQFFMYLAPEDDLLKVESSRFPTLIAVARELEKRDNNCATFGHFEFTSMDGTDQKMVKDLVKIHRQLMPHNRCPA